MGTITDSTGTRPCPRVRLTALAAKRICRELFQACPSIYRGDRVAQREHWFNVVDQLCTDGLISQRQRDTWICPF